MQANFPFPFNVLPAEFNWQLSMWAELICPLLLLLGFGTRLASVVLAVVTVVAIASVHWPAHWSSLAELAQGAATTRRGLRPEGRAPIREGVAIYAEAAGGEPVCHVSSGGFGPSVGGPVAMARLPVDLPEGTTVYADLRGKRVPVAVTALPFVTPSYKR